MKKNWQNMFMSTIILPKVLDIIEVIDKIKQNWSNLLQLREKTYKEYLVKFTKDQTLH